MSHQQPVAPVDQDALKELYADWSEIIATTPDLTMRLFRSIFDEWHQPTREPRTSPTPRRPSAASRASGPCRRRGHLAGAALHPRRRIRRRFGVQPPQARRARRQGAGRARPSSSTTVAPPSTRTPPARGRRRGLPRAHRGRHRARGHHDHRRLGRRQPRRRHRARAARARQAAARPVIAFSPWLDMENKGETLVTNDATDALITVALLEGMIAGVLGDQTSPDRSAREPAVRRLLGLPAALRHRRRCRDRSSTTPPGSPIWPRLPGST